MTNLPLHHLSNKCRGETPLHQEKGKKQNNLSLDIEVSLDEVIKMPQLDLENLTLEKKKLLQEILAKKKRQEKLRREHQQKKVFHYVKDIFVEAFDIQNFDGKVIMIFQLVNIAQQ